jgi:hypothetical protein
LSALTRQLQSDSGGCASHNSERTTLSIHGEDSIRVLMISVDVINERYFNDSEQLRRLFGKRSR